MIVPMTTDDIWVLASEGLVPWSVAWRALGPSGPSRDAARAACEATVSRQRADSSCATDTE